MHWKTLIFDGSQIKTSPDNECHVCHLLEKDRPVTPPLYLHSQEAVSVTRRTACKRHKGAGREGEIMRAKKCPPLCASVSYRQSRRIAFTSLMAGDPFAHS